MGLSRNDVEDAYQRGKDDGVRLVSETLSQLIGAADHNLVEELKGRMEESERTISRLDSEVTDLQFKLREIQPWEV